MGASQDQKFRYSGLATSRATREGWQCLACQDGSHPSVHGSRCLTCGPRRRRRPVTVED